MDILLSNDIRLLIISGTPSREEVVQAWQDILNESSDLIATEKTKSIFELWKKITYAEYQLYFISHSLSYLKEMYDEEIAAALAELGYSFIEDIPNREAYLKQIYFIETEAKTLVVLLNQWNVEYKAMNPGGNESKRTAADYEKELQILSRYMGYRIRKEEITTLEYYSIASNYIQQNKKP